jgi:hypothetical protein
MLCVIHRPTGRRARLVSDRDLRGGEFLVRPADTTDLEYWPAHECAAASLAYRPDGRVAQLLLYLAGCVEFKELRGDAGDVDRLVRAGRSALAGLLPDRDDLVGLGSTAGRAVLRGLQHTTGRFAEDLVAVLAEARRERCRAARAVRRIR